MVTFYILSIEIPQTTQTIIVPISNLEINQHQTIHISQVDRVLKKTTITGRVQAMY